MSIAPSAGGGRYAVIPLDPQVAGSGLSLGSGSSVDGAGRRIAYGRGGYDQDFIFVLDRPTGVLSRLYLDGSFSISKQISGSGRYFFFQGVAREGTVSFPMSRLDIDNGSIGRASQSSPILFRADRAGQRVAYMHRPLGPETPSQYFLYDFPSSTSTQLSDAADAIGIDPTAPRCVFTQGGTPVISGDGERVIVITPSTLGLADRPWVEGACNVLEYIVAQRRWRRVATLPARMRVEFPTIDDAGTLLSFIATEPFGGTGRRTTPQLLSLETGELVTLPPALYTQAGFDSVVTRDGTSLVVSSRADLDPLGGNDDQNMEIFLLNLATMTFAQVTFSTGGIGTLPGGCSAFEPSRNDDGSVLVFATPILSIAPCQLDGPMRDERTGMVLTRVRTVPRRAGNRAPSLSWSGPTAVGVGEELVLRLAAEDPDGDPLTFFANALRDAITLPEVSLFAQDGPQTATLRWQPSEAQRGTHDLRLAVFDEGGDVATTDVQVTVCGAVYDTPCRARAVAAIFGASAGSCGDASGDGEATAADLVAVARRAHTCIPDVG